MRGLQRRGSMFRFRRGVPAKLRPIIGKREIVRSLKTRDPRVAERWALTVAAEVDRQFAEAEGALKNPSVRVYKVLQQDAEDRTRWPRAYHEEEGEAHAIMAVLERLDGDHPPEATTQRTILEAILKRLHGGEDTSAADNPPLSMVFDRWRAERKPPAKTWEEWAMVCRRFQQMALGKVRTSSSPSWVCGPALALRSWDSCAPRM